MDLAGNVVQEVDFAITSSACWGPGDVIYCMFVGNLKSYHLPTSLEEELIVHTEFEWPLESCDLDVDHRGVRVLDESVIFGNRMGIFKYDLLTESVVQIKKSCPKYYYSAGNIDPASGNMLSRVTKLSFPDFYTRIEEYEWVLMNDTGSVIQTLDLP